MYIIVHSSPILVFYSARHHRDLHSFPTRRSSDLFEHATGPKAARGQNHDSAIGLDQPIEMRSEEHTSELQSHSDLVCRLLLEKKNQIKLYWRDLTGTTQ